MKALEGCWDYLFKTGFEARKEAVVETAARMMESVNLPGHSCMKIPLHIWEEVTGILGMGKNFVKKESTNENQIPLHVWVE